MSAGRARRRFGRMLVFWLAISLLASMILPQASPVAGAYSSLYELGCQAGPYGRPTHTPLTKYPVIVVPGTAASFLWGPNTLTHQGNWLYWFSAGQLSTNGIPPLAPNPNSDLLRLKKNPDGTDIVPGIYVGDMFRWLDVGGNWGPGLPGWASGDVYYSLLAFLNCMGYTENDQFVQGGNGWLNVFPYDWRDAPGANGALLAQRVQQVLQSTGASKVILIAHSLGGLVARSYIAGQFQDSNGNTYTGGSRVAALIDIATPWLGTPRVTQAMTVGWNFGIPGMNPSWGQILAPNWPMVYAQSPTASGLASTSYFTAYPEGFLTASLNDEQIVAGDAAGQDAAIRAYNPQEYDEITQWRSQVFDGETHGVANYLIAGYNHPADETISLDGLGGNDTIDRLEISQHKQTCPWWQPWPVCDPNKMITDANVHLGPGDDTVPLGSALLGQMPAYPGPQGAGPVPVASSPIGAFTYYLVTGSDVAHMALPGNDRVLADVRSILTGLDAAPVPGRPKVTGLRPVFGDASGGTPVVISGSGFTGATAVTFGGVAAKGTAVSDSEIRVTAPPAAKGAGSSVDVQVQGPGGTSATGQADVFTYDDALQNLGITPESGPAGTNVTITGSGLGSTTSVTFGSASAQFRVVSDSELTAVAPAGTNGTTVHVTIINAAGPNRPSQWTRADGYVQTINDPRFTYNAGKTITVTTTTLPDASVGQPYSQTLQATGGDGSPFTWSPGQVCVSGCTQAAAVTQGEALTYGPATLPRGLTLDPDGTIHGTPSGGPAQVTLPVVVTDQSGDTANGQVTFNVTENAATCAADPQPAPTDGSPVVAGVSPSTVADNGSQTITITGYNLRGTVGVTFARPAANVYISATAVQVEPDGSVKAVTPVQPNLPDGTYDVYLTLYHLDFTGLNSAFNCHDRVTVVPAASLQPVTPSGTFTPTSAAPGQRVTLTGKALPGSVMSAYLYCAGCDPAGVHVGVANVGGDGSYSLTFPIPAGAQPGPANVEAGCDTCGNGWTNFAALTVAAAPAATPPPAPSPTTPSTTTPSTAPPVVKGLSPAFGSDTGGDPVTLTGSGLAGATSVMFGDFGTAQIVSASPDGTSLQVKTPQAWWGDGPVYVQVISPDGQSAVTQADYFTYQAGASTSGSSSTGASGSVSPVCSAPTATPFDKQVAGCPGYGG